MIVYNVTAKIDYSIEEDWLQWMKFNHIPDVLKTGHFSGYRMSRVMSLQDDDGVTYAVEYHCASTADLHKYEVQNAPALRKEYSDRYAGKYVTYRSIMEVVQKS